MSTGERGSSLVEFLGSALIIVLGLLTSAQMAVWIWARGVTVNAAHEGARAAASLGASTEAAEWQARGVLQDGLGSSGRRFAVEARRGNGAVRVVVRGEAPRMLAILPAFPVEGVATVIDESVVLP
ncbi:MAG: hypothetical protein RL531_1861 [Actinomycetota bacterium]